MESFRPDLASSVGPRPIADLPAAASPKIEPTIAALLLYKRENETTTSARPVDQPLPARPKAPVSHLSLLPTSSNPRSRPSPSVTRPAAGVAQRHRGEASLRISSRQSLVGKLVTADLASFEDDGPAHIEILCPATAEIDGLSLIFFFDSRVRRLTFELESPAAVDLHSPAPGASAPGDDGREGDGGSSEESSFCEEDDGNGGVPPVASDGPHTPGSTSSSPSSSAGVASRVASGIEPVIIVGPSRVVTNLVVHNGVEVLGDSSPVATTADDLEFTEADILSVGMEVCLRSATGWSVTDARRGPLLQPWDPWIGCRHYPWTGNFGCDP
ncbi:hypothetical protein ZWY2020_042126 [Hordeum vulgare]|nr:hypothetical protein ZWY2020_042126 [Hordeum vulgare]